MKKQFNQILSVEQFNSLIKEVLSGIGYFKIKGEISEYKISQNRGLFITLTDGKSNLRVKGYAPSVKGADLVEKGMSVVVRGQADLYVPYGSFSLSATSIEPEGEGALNIAYQKLKEKLEKEGLFAPEHKKQLPVFIRSVALLTGKDSAAYSDFTKILKEHECGIKVLHYSVLVQGEKSIASIKTAINDARESDVDLIVVTRGGGSSQDLKSFNNEELARTIFSCPKLVIAGVGHENDESIADFVADLRASTPSQAAYYIARKNEDFVNMVERKGLFIHEMIENEIQIQRQTLENRVFTIEVLLDKIMQNLNKKIETLQKVLKSYNLKSILKRGFAILQREGEKIGSIRDVYSSDELKALLYDGSFSLEVKKIHGK